MSEEEEPPAVKPEVVAELARWSTPTVLNGLKRLGVHPADLVSLDRLAVGCMSPQLGVRVGFAVTRRVVTSRYGSAGNAERGRTAMLGQDLLTQPAPRVLVVENVGDWRGPVCVFGELVATVSHALGCVAGITNGPVRDLPEMERIGFQTYAGGPGVGGGFVDVVEFGGPVVIGGVRISPGDLLHGDRHGVVRVPAGLAAGLPAAMREHADAERRLFEVCRAPDFSPEKLARALENR